MNAGPLNNLSVFHGEDHHGNPQLLASTFRKDFGGVAMVQEWMLGNGTGMRIISIVCLVLSSATLCADEKTKAGELAILNRMIGDTASATLHFPADGKPKIEESLAWINLPSPDGKRQLLKSTARVVTRSGVENAPENAFDLRYESGQVSAITYVTHETMMGPFHVAAQGGKIVRITQCDRTSGLCITATPELCRDLRQEMNVPNETPLWESADQCSITLDHLLNRGPFFQKADLDQIKSLNKEVGGTLEDYKIQEFHPLPERISPATRVSTDKGGGTEAGASLRAVAFACDLIRAAPKARPSGKRHAGNASGGPH